MIAGITHLVSTRRAPSMDLLGACCFLFFLNSFQMPGVVGARMDSRERNVTCQSMIAFLLLVPTVGSALTIIGVTPATAPLVSKAPIARSVLAVSVVGRSHQY